jgi:hypothetical protein
MADDPTVTPLASPITVGELTDVPVPLSPIAAQFHQEVANRVAHRFPNVTAMNAWAAGDGALAFALPARFYVRTAGAWRPVPFYDELQAIADRLVTSAMIQDATIVAADLAPSVLSTAWTSFGDTGSNWTGESGYYKRLGNSVHFHFQGALAAAGITPIYTLPVGYRPAGTLYFNNYPGATGWQIAPDGLVSLLAPTTGAQIGIVYALDATFPV